MKLVRLTDMCLNKIYKVSVAKHVSDLFHTQNYLKEGNVVSFQHGFRIYHGNSQRNSSRGEIEWDMHLLV